MGLADNLLLRFADVVTTYHRTAAGHRRSGVMEIYYLQESKGKVFYAKLKDESSEGALPALGGWGEG